MKRAAMFTGIVIGSFLVTVGCGIGADTTAPRPETSAPATSADESKDWCAEHEVAESLCTRCNASLRPAFKATGDWCEEHGFPLSICTVHYPERGGRPAVAIETQPQAEPTRAESATNPSEGTLVKFKSAETARLAGIRTEPAVSGSIASGITVTARIVYDATRVARLNARSPGVVRSILADLGERVRAGAPLALIESPEAGAHASTLQASRSRAENAQANLDRITRLRDRGIASEREVLAARQDLADARGDLGSERAAVGIVGSTDGLGRYSLSSPIGGFVVQRTAAIGEMVSVDQILFEVVETSKMWAEIEIPEAHLSSVTAGRPVVLILEDGSGREYSSTISFIAPGIDPHTRTAKARAPLENPDGALHANMFARARISVTGPVESVLVTMAAVQRFASADGVFVRQADDQYVLRLVRRGEPVDSRVVVVGQVRHGDQVATDGAFFLKTETLKESIGAGCCPIE